MLAYGLGTREIVNVIGRLPHLHICKITPILYEKEQSESDQVNRPIIFDNIYLLKVAGAASVSVDFFPHNMLGYTELNVDPTKNIRH